VLSVLRGVVRAIRVVASVVVVLCFVYMTVAVLAQVFGRYVFNYSISWTEETARFAQIWVVFIGAGITMRFGWHVSVDVLAAMLPLKLARAVSIRDALYDVAGMEEESDRIRRTSHRSRREATPTEATPSEDSASEPASEAAAGEPQAPPVGSDA